MLLKAFTIDVLELQVLIWENLGDLLRRMKNHFVSKSAFF